MIHYASSDFIPLREFAFAWRLTDAGKSMLPAATLQRIRALTPARAKQLKEISPGFGQQSLRFDPVRYRAIKQCSLGENTEFDSQRIKAWLRGLSISPESEIYLSWANEGVAAFTDWATFTIAWNDLWYPFDRLSVFDDSSDWAVILGPEEYAVYIASRQADPQLPAKDTVQFNYGTIDDEKLGENLGGRSMALQREIAKAKLKHRNQPDDAIIVTKHDKQHSNGLHSTKEQRANNMSHAKSGGLWARLMSLVEDKEEKPAETAPSPAVKPAENGAAPPAAGPVETAPATAVAEAEIPFAEEEAPIPFAEEEAPIVPPAVAEPEKPAPSPFEFPNMEMDTPTPPFFDFATQEHPVPHEAEVAPAEPASPAAVASLAPTLPELFLHSPEPVAPPPSGPVMVLCPVCQSTAEVPVKYCADCGYLFPADAAATMAVGSANSPKPRPAMPTMSKVRIKGRYELQEMTSEYRDIRRHKGLDHGDGRGKPVPVVIVTATAPVMSIVTEEALVTDVEEEILPGFDNIVEATPIDDVGGWPSLAWEKSILEKASHPGLPAVREHFVDGTAEYLIEEVPQGRSIWDSWDEPDSTASVRYAWLQQTADILLALAKAGAIIEGVRPDIITIDDDKARITDLADLLPIPLPNGAPVRATLYTAPEMILTPERADGRANLYSLGATLYALEYLHHGLEEKDFERQYVPRQVTDRFPDVHPFFPRFLNKTFVREIHYRFPSDEMTKNDPTGLIEFKRTCDVARRILDRVRLDIAAWTTTGMVRTGNEDAFTFLHGVDGRLDDVFEYAMVLVADGMGGYEAGEVAAAMALAELKKYLLQQPLFAGLTGKSMPPPVSSDQVPACKEVLKAGLKHANKEVFAFSRTPGKGKRTMGCTAEAVYVDCQNVIVGHVGDSRTYHLHEGRLVQLTRDQTLVNRLVELGQLTAEEAENHDRKNELQQAVGAQPDVDPGIYHGKLKRGDWVLVCSDGLTNHIPNGDLEKMLSREAAGSAEDAARRLLNLVNLRGATDNATIVVVRAT
jgi:protein phosphatase